MQLSVAEVHHALAATRPEQECIVVGDHRLTWAGFVERTNRLSAHLIGRGLGCHVERDRLAAWESGQDHLAVHLHNGAEYLEAMVAAFGARVAPMNVNHRYVADELRHVLADGRARAIVVHGSLTPSLAQVLGDLPEMRVILQVDDGSGAPLLPGAQWYEEALAAASPAPPAPAWSPDDLYVLYTGGTTGMPKGVLWRNGDAAIECFGAPASARTAGALAARARRPVRALLAAPLMHGAGHWVCFRTWYAGGTVHLPAHPERFDPAEIWATVERERVTFLLIVGDAFARPLLDELDRVSYDASSLTVILSGGAPLSPRLKSALMQRLPTVMIVDGLGSSETGGQLVGVTAGQAEPSDRFPPSPGTHVLSADLDRVLAGGDAELGWLAKSGRLALGYLGDPDATRRTFPTIDGVRYGVPGDRARLQTDGTISVLGRESATINTGGEKVFAEEVEAAIGAHPDVHDCVVAGRPSERWGQEVVAIVQLRSGATADTTELLATAGRHLARYKLPKAVLYVPEVARSPSGKPDYRWAARVAASCDPAAAVGPQGDPQ